MANVSLEPGKTPMKRRRHDQGRRERHLHPRSTAPSRSTSSATTPSSAASCSTRSRTARSPSMLEDVAYQIRTPEFWNACVGHLRRDATTAWAARSSTARASPARSRRCRTVVHRALQRHQRHQHRALARLIGPGDKSHEHHDRSPGQGDPRQGRSRCRRPTNAPPSWAVRRDGNIRFALNNVSTSGLVTDTQLGVQVAFGKRVGTATINEF